MYTIYKYPLKLVDTQRIRISEISLPLSVQFQGKDLFMWVEHDTTQPLIDRIVHIVGTGEDIPLEILLSRYVGTVQNNGFVWHIYVDL